MDKNKQGAGADKKQGAGKHGQGKPQRTGFDQPTPQPEEGGRRPDEIGRPDQPDKGRESTERKDGLDREGRERSDRDAGAGRPVQLDPDQGGEAAPRR